MATTRSPRPAALARSGAELGLRRLTELLVEPLGLRPEDELVVVPVGALQQVPWPALHPGPTSLAPSASSWARSLQPGDPPREHVVLVSGPGLPGAVAEVRALRSHHPDAVVLEPPDSTVDAVAAALAGADLVHLACHGRLRADNPAFSSLVLSDGPLSVHEIDLRGLAPRRVVLAACDSAADVALEGNELFGFVTALFARGTTAVAASIVAVPDVDAVPLMCALHEQLVLGQRLAPALHAARATLDLDDPGAFVNWCAFAAYGAG